MTTQPDYHAFEKAVLAFCKAYTVAHALIVLTPNNLTPKKLKALLLQPDVFNYLTRPPENAIDADGKDNISKLENQIYKTSEMLVPERHRIPYRFGKTDHIYDAGSFVPMGDTLSKEMARYSNYSPTLGRHQQPSVSAMYLDTPAIVIDSPKTHLAHLPAMIFNILKNNGKITDGKTLIPLEMPKNFLPQKRPNHGYSCLFFPYYVNVALLPPKHQSTIENFDSHALCYGLIINNETNAPIAAIHANSWVLDEDPYRGFLAESLQKSGLPNVPIIDISISFQQDNNCVLNAHEFARILVEYVKENPDDIVKFAKQIEPSKLSHSMRIGKNSTINLTEKDTLLNEVKAIDTLSMSMKERLWSQLEKLYPNAVENAQVDSAIMRREHNLTKWAIGNAKLHDLKTQFEAQGRKR